MNSPRKTEAESALELGNEYPFDAPDSWWEGGQPIPPAQDWAHRAARGILADLRDRRGIKSELNHHIIDEDTRKNLVETLSAIIRLAERDR